MRYIVRALGCLLLTPFAFVIVGLQTVLDLWIEIMPDDEED
jgi:hypothetical protein